VGQPRRGAPRPALRSFRAPRAAPGDDGRDGERSGGLNAEIERIYRAESRRVFATLIRLLGDFDTAEEALHEAFRAALEQWPKEGLPANPRAWLVSAGRFKAIDSIRRNARFDALSEEQ